MSRPIWTGAMWGSAVQVPLEITLHATELTLEADTNLTLRAPAVQAEVTIANYSGALKSQVLTTNTVIAQVYTPGAGNLM